MCPPKHTYTNLNYDIINTRNVSLNKDQIEELTNLVDKQMENAEHQQLMTEVNSVFEENKFYNWYWDLSDLFVPQYKVIWNHK